MSRFPRPATQRQGALAGALDRLVAAAVGSADMDMLLQEIVAMFADLLGAELSVLRLREGDALRPRAGTGLEDGLAAARALSVDDPDVQSLATQMDASRAILTPAIHDLSGEALQSSGARSVSRIPLRDAGDVVALVDLGFKQERPITDDDEDVVARLAPRAGAVVARQVAFDRLQGALRARDEVLAVVAHDLRNPLNVISVATTTLLQRTTDPPGRRQLERVLRGAQRADRLIRDLLEVNAIESGKFSLETAPVEPADLILSVLESQQSLAEDASVIIRTDLSPDLPPIDADEERLLEVLENLVGNAIKFTGAGGSITVAASRHGTEIVFSVRDSGSGIAPEHLPRIFNRFWRAHESTRGGTGLGLSICKAIVHAHGGRIWAESDVGAGTTLSFTVPARRAQPSEGSDPDVIHILLVDDRADNLLSLKAILERPEYKLVTATSGEEALRLVLRERFSVALIDVSMPGMNGFEVAVHLKELERTRDIPILFITAFGDDPREIHRAYAAGGADYLVKPLDPEIVRKKVAVFSHLGRRRHTS